ncbi:MAG: FtsW/RodA/SpoVE family cell cycle protein [Caldisericaceae bacterium]
MKKVPFSLILILILLTAYSVTALYVLNGNFSLSSRQLLYSLAGFVLMYFMMFFDFRILKTFSYFFYGVALFLLLVVFALGVAKFSSKRWIDFGGLFTFQPSELAKIAVILVAATVLQLDRLNNFNKFLIVALLTFGVDLFIFMQPDMGSSLVIGFIFLMMVLFSLPFKYFASVVAALGVALPFGVKLLKPYQIERFLVFLNPQRDPLGSGYNVIQSVIAVGSGGLFGKGISGSTMTKLKFVPVQYSDFIFSAIGEIYGFVGSAILILLMGLILLFIIRAYSSTDNKFGKGIALGVFSMFIFQILVNIGMAVGIMPVTGIPLPFVSYGGSAEIVNYIALGLALNVYIYKDEINIGL